MLAIFATFLSYLPWNPSAQAATPTGTPENVQLIAAVLVHEAGGEGYAGMHAVASVIRNRALKFNTTMTYQAQRPSQFSCLNGHTPYGLIQSARFSPMWELAMIAAEQLADYRRVWFDNSFGATYFEKSSVRPSWATGMRITRCLGHHTFYAPATDPHYFVK